MINSYFRVSFKAIKCIQKYGVECATNSVVRTLISVFAITIKKSFKNYCTNDKEGS